jgi:hypothetical protein
LLAQGILERCSDEFTAPVGLHTLNGEGKFGQQSFLEKVDGIGSGAPGVEAQDA